MAGIHDEGLHPYVGPPGETGATPKKDARAEALGSGDILRSIGSFAETSERTAISATSRASKAGMDKIAQAETEMLRGFVTNFTEQLRPFARNPESIELINKINEQFIKDLEIAPTRKTRDLAKRLGIEREGTSLIKTMRNAIERILSPEMIKNATPEQIEKIVSIYKEYVTFIAPLGKFSGYEPHLMNIAMELLKKNQVKEAVAITKLIDREMISGTDRGWAYVYSEFLEAFDRLIRPDSSAEEFRLGEEIINLKAIQDSDKSHLITKLFTFYYNKNMVDHELDFLKRANNLGDDLKLDTHMRLIHDYYWKNQKAKAFQLFDSLPSDIANRLKDDFELMTWALHFLREDDIVRLKKVVKMSETKDSFFNKRCLIHKGLILHLLTLDRLEEALQEMGQYPKDDQINSLFTKDNRNKYTRDGVYSDMALELAKKDKNKAIEIVNKYITNEQVRRETLAKIE